MGFLKGEASYTRSVASSKICLWIWSVPPKWMWIFLVESSTILIVRLNPIEVELILVFFVVEASFTKGDGTWMAIRDNVDVFKFLSTNFNFEILPPPVAIEEDPLTIELGWSFVGRQFFF